MRANASGLARAVALDVPPALAGLRFIIVVDGPQPESAWIELRALARQRHLELIATKPGRHGWPAGAGAARNTGIAHSRADWILFLDDDTTPNADLLHRYAEAMAATAGSGLKNVFGFAGVTVFMAREDSLWAVAARSSGMIDAFSAASRAHQRLTQGQTAHSTSGAQSPLIA